MSTPPQMTSGASVTTGGIMSRIMGVITLKAPVYREIADDTTATSQAAIIVVIFALVAAGVGAAIVGVLGSSLPQGSQFGQSLNPVAAALRSFVDILIGWVVGSWVFAFVSKTFFGGKTNTGEMLRVFGFTQVFQIFAIIPCCGWAIAWVLGIIGAIIGIREASEFDTGKAVITGIVGLVALLVVYFVIGLLFSAVGLG